MDWVVRRNIEQFQQMIAAETDPKRLVLLAALLGEEQAKLAAIEAGGAPGEPSDEA